MSPRPGEVWLADLGLAAKTRPIVILSRSDPGGCSRSNENEISDGYQKRAPIEAEGVLSQSRLRCYWRKICMF